MNPIKDLKFVILFIIIILALVIVRTFDKNRFKQDPKIAVEAVHNNNLITQAHLEQLTTPYLIVDLGGEGKFDHPPFKNVIHVPFEKLLEESNRKIMKETKDDIILYSTDSSTAAKAWLILNQLGIKRLFILTTEEKQEVLKYKFQPDTMARLEQDSM